jgi:methyl-accepting chemotaxis protein
MTLHGDAIVFKQYICSSIRNKLLMITGVGTSLVLAAGAWGMYQGWQAEHLILDAVHVQTGYELRLSQVTTEFKVQVQEWKNVLLRGHDPQQREKYWAKFGAQHEKVQRQANSLLDEIKDEVVHGELQEFTRTHLDMYESYTRGYQVYINSGFDATAGDAAVKGIDRKPTELLQSLAPRLEQLSHQAIINSDESIVKMIQSTGLVVLLAVIASFIGFLLMISNNIVTPAKTLVADLARMASGDFTHKISVSSGDEIGQVASSAARLQEDMNQIVKQINQSVFRVSASAEEMAHITEQSNQAMMSQRNETDQVATAMNEMTATVHEVAQNAQLAAGSANQANSEVNTGQAVVNDAIRAIASLVQKVERAADVIQELESNSNEIGSVLDVIRSIAEQTNLLALNAAIEAARAGEQGRGFAVVADEVRVLAQRTQKSTQEIQGMIQRLQTGAQEAVESMKQSRSQADTTRDTAARAGQVLTSITKAVTNINDMNALIASAAEEQNAVAEEINRNIVNISSAAENTAESAAQTANASEELRNVAEELKHVVSRLKV